MSVSRTVKIQIQLPENLRTHFKAKCVVEGMTMNEVLIQLIEDWTNADKDETSRQPTKPDTKKVGN